MRRLLIAVCLVFLVVNVLQAQPAPASNVTSVTLPHTGVLMVKQISNVYGNFWVMVTYAVETIAIGGSLFLVSKYFKIPKDGDPHFALLNREQIFLTAALTAASVNTLNGFFNAIAEIIRNSWNIPADQKAIRIEGNGAVAVNDL